MKIETPDDFPPQILARYLEMRLRYRKTRLWDNDDEADAACFRDMRSEFWRGIQLNDNAQPNNTPHERTHRT